MSGCREQSVLCGYDTRNLTYTEAVDAFQASVDFEPAIWARLMQAPKAPIAPDAARYLLSIDFSEHDHARMQELMAWSKEGALIPDMAWPFTIRSLAT